MQQNVVSKISKVAREVSNANNTISGNKRGFDASLTKSITHKVNLDMRKMQRIKNNITMYDDNQIKHKQEQNAMQVNIRTTYQSRGRPKSNALARTYVKPIAGSLVVANDELKDRFLSGR